MSVKAASAMRFLVAALVMSLTLPSMSSAKAVSPDFVDLAKRLKPTVVNIRTAKVIKPRNQQQRPRMQSPFDNFFDEFFNQFNGPQQRPRREQSLGTGFIIDREGYILTNNHVVNGADEVMVKLSDGREIKGEIKGTDEKLDIALIKISHKDPFPAAELGDSGQLEVGEWVMAIGNPFGLSETVTAGIVSAKGRIIGNSPYDDFIQTDASINPGNSGGPLFNTAGKVVGINTAIIAGGQGIGFAIPINLVKAVTDQLRDTGKVTRGYLGVRFQPLTANLAKSFGLESEKGVVISNVEKDTPAEKAGLKAGDVILEYDGRPIAEANELPRYVAATPIGSKVPVVIYRDGKRQEVTVQVGRLKGDDSDPPGPDAGETVKLGITVRELTGELAARLNIRDTKGGLVITEVRPGSSADDAGVVPGTVIIEIRRQRPDTLDKFNTVVAGIRKGDLVPLLLRRPDGSHYYIAVTAE